MSNERHETVADIVRKMRTLGRLDEKSTDKIPRSLQALGLRYTPTASMRRTSGSRFQRQNSGRRSRGREPRLQT